MERVVREILPTITKADTNSFKQQRRVAAYCRVSTDSDEQELSFEAQVNYYTNKIMTNPDWRMAGIFADEGITGTQALCRPQFMEMIRKCRRKQIDLILIKSVSRFARNIVDSLSYVRELKKLGIEIYFEKEGLSSLKDTTEVYLAFHSIFAQAESESLSLNVRMGKAMSAKSGKVNFSYSTFLGYRRGADNQPEIVESEAVIVRMIYECYLEGYSLKEICLKLESHNILTPMKKKKWSSSTVKSILTNEKYKGDALLQKTYVIDCISHKTKKNDDRPQYYVENNHPAIIERDVFDRVQIEMAKRTSKNKVKKVGTITEAGKYSSKYALTDVLICGHCGTPYRRVTWSRNGVKKIVWRCISRLDYGTKYCKDSPSIEESLLQNAIVKSIKDVMSDDSCHTALINLKMHIQMYFGRNDENSTANDELRVKKLVHQITDLASSGHYSEQMKALVEELNEVKKIIADKKSKEDSATETKHKVNDILNYMEKYKDKPITFTNQAVRQLIECIRVMSKNEIQIIYKGGLERDVKLE